MNFLNRASNMHTREDSFVISDSEEEVETSFRRNKTTIDTKIIGDTDSEKDFSNYDSYAESSKEKSNNEFEDSETEDLQFINNSHRVSIIEHSSESERDLSEDESEKINKYKRRSIYDNAVDTPNSESTPINHLRKKSRKTIIYSDSDSENTSFKCEKTSAEKSRRNIIDFNDKDDETNFEEILNESTFEMKEKNENSTDSNEKDWLSDQESSENSDFDKKKASIHSEKCGIKNNEEYKTFSEKKLASKRNIKSEPEQLSKIIDLTINDLSNNYSNKEQKIDLTIDDSKHDYSMKYKNLSFNRGNKISVTDSDLKNDSTANKSPIDNSFRNKQKVDDDDVIICSSTSTSESEMDNEVITLAKKEIGVGNIDPIEAQKKELLLLNIDFTQKQLDKLNKFAASIDINKLPDKGEKVHKTIKEYEEKLTTLQMKLEKISKKISLNRSKNVQTPKTKVEYEFNIKENKSMISPFFDNKKSIDLKNFEKKHSAHDSQFTNQFDDFDIKDIPSVPDASFDAADLGKKALATLNKQQTLTHQRLEQLHGSLTSRPTEDQKEKDPNGLKVLLMPHQQHALAWMKWREKQKPKGGILADDMGLGKTLSMISLILATLNYEERDSDDSDERNSDDSSEWLSRNKKHKRYYGGTLVVCPASLIKQWEAEIKNRCKRGLLSVLVFHGNNRNIEDRKLSKFNVVITTYQTLVREADGETAMYRMEWNRVILDEAHYIRNHKSKASIAACGLSAKYRWALTGTPIQNKEMDVYAILKFLKCTPFSDLQVWKRWVDNKNDAGKQRLITIMKTVMLRRTKQELQSKGSLNSLPDKNLEIIEIEMDRDENLAYQKILLFSQNLFAQFLAQRAEKQHMRELHGGKFDRPSYSSLGSKTQFTKAQQVLLDHHSNVEAHEILVLLLRLRQMCCHPALIHSMLDQHDAEVNGLDEEDDANIDLLNQLQNMSINEDENIEEHVANYKIDKRVAANLLTKKNPVFDNDRRSSKVRAIIQTIEEILEKGDKVIVVSQWTSFLEIVAKHLNNIDDANYVMFTGAVAVKNRQAIVDKLNDPDEDVNILLLSLTAGGVGLNLVGANHLLLIDIHWNPQLEAQAQDRIYRFGQNKSVYIYKFICKDTIEERVKNLQDKKLEIANHVLTGTRSISSKLTIEDLKLLFS